MPNVIDLSGGTSSGRRLTPQEQLAQAMLQQGVSGAPVRHPMEGIGRIAQALAGAYIGKQGQDKREKEATAGTQDMAQMAALIAGGQRGGLQSTGGAGGDQVADVPTVEPGLSAFSEGMRRHGTSPAVQRNMPQMLALAQAYQKEKPKAPEGFQFNAQGALEPIQGYVEGKGALARATRKTPEEIQAEAQAGWKSPERLQQEAEIAARTQAKYREPREPRAPEAPIEVYDPNSPTGTRLVSRAEAVGQPGKPPSGMRVTTNPDGTVSIEQGRQNMNSKTVSTLEEKVVNATEGLARISQISKSFKPEFQQIGSRWQAMTTAFKEKAGFEPDPDSKKQLTEFSTYKREALSNLNLYIKEITGAAMSIQEAERITRALPNPGTGLFDGDSPTEFQAKMASVQRELKGVVARANYALKNGLDPKSIPLEKVPDLMRARMGQLQQEIQLTRPDLAPDAANAEIKGRLLKEFGIPSDG